MQNLKWFTIPRFPKYEINEALQVRHKQVLKIKSCYVDDGYLKLNIQGANCERHKPYLHQLVANTFVPNPENKRDVHHIDGDKQNNIPSNLMWVTPAEHRQISKENEQTCHKISVKDVLYIRWVYTPELKKELSKKYKVSQNTIYNIAIGSARKDVGGKIHEPTGCFKKIVNIETGKIINSSDELATILGIKRRYIHRQLSGERYCHIPYRYVGKEDAVRIKPITPPRTKLMAKFDSNGNHIETIDLYNTDNCTLKQRIGAFFNGNSSSVGGFTYKKVAVDGSFIEPTPFISKKKVVVRKPVTPAKEVIKYSISGDELQRYPSMLHVAKEFKMDKRDVRNRIRQSPRNYFKGFIWKYADAV